MIDLLLAALLMLPDRAFFALCDRLGIDAEGIDFLMGVEP